MRCCLVATLFGNCTVYNVLYSVHVSLPGNFLLLYLYLFESLHNINVHLFLHDSLLDFGRLNIISHEVYSKKCSNSICLKWTVKFMYKMTCHMKRPLQIRPSEPEPLGARIFGCSWSRHFGPAPVLVPAPRLQLHFSFIITQIIWYLFWYLCKSKK